MFSLPLHLFLSTNSWGKCLTHELLNVPLCSPDRRCLFVVELLQPGSKTSVQAGKSSSAPLPPQVKIGCRVSLRDLFHTFSFYGMIKIIDHSSFIRWYKCSHIGVRGRNRQSKTCFLYYWSDGQTAVQRHSGNRQWHTSLYTAFYTEEAKHLQNRKKHVKGPTR